MRDPAPLTIQRLLTLRQSDALTDVDLAELATVAENVVERTFAPGTLIVHAGGRFAGAHLIDRGQFESTLRAWGPHRFVGALEILAGRTSTQRIVSSVSTRTLFLPATSFAELLEDNFGLLSATRRHVARAMLAHATASHRRPLLPRLDHRTLGMVDRIMILRAHLPFAHGNLQAVSALAQASEEVQFAAGAQIQEAGADPTGTLVILDGQIRLSHREGAEVTTAASAIGGLESLAEVALRYDAYALTPVRALRLPSAALFDVMEDHTELAIAMLRRLASSLLDLQALPPELN